MSSFTPRYSAPQRDAVARAYDERQIRPARVVDLAAAGTLEEGLPGFTYGGNIVSPPAGSHWVLIGDGSFRAGPPPAEADCQAMLARSQAVNPDHKVTTSFRRTSQCAAKFGKLTRAQKASRRPRARRAGPGPRRASRRPRLSTRTALCNPQRGSCTSRDDAVTEGLGGRGWSPCGGRMATQPVTATGASAYLR